jgi:hypothetical protein
MLYKNGVNLQEPLENFLANSSNLFIYSPYIKLESLKGILKKPSDCNLIVVRWEAQDLVHGISDLEVFDFCKVNNIALYRNKRLHLKAFVDNYKTCFFGSSNISSKGLNIPSNQNYNYELNSIVENLSIDDRLYFSRILNESILVTDDIYNQIKNQLPLKKKEPPPPTDFFLNISIPDKNFLISSLPMTFNVKTLLRICETRETINEVELNCAMHDLALYDLELGIQASALKVKLTENFFAHPFIVSFLENLDASREIYFGAAKDWIQKNCTDVPTPRKWEITENIQILYRWIVDLGDGKYAVDRPNYSERLYIK